MIAGIAVRIDAGGIKLLVAKWAWADPPLNIEAVWDRRWRAFTRAIGKNDFSIMLR